VLVPAVVSLALGIGANVALTGFLDDLLFRPPGGVREPEEIVRLFFQEPKGRPQAEVSYPMFHDLKGHVDAFDELAALTTFDGSLGRGLGAHPARIGLATYNFFPLLGVSTVRGRSFTKEEGDPRRAEPVALLSWSLWQRGFAGRADVVGRTLPVGGQSYTVIGILPQGFSGLDVDPVDLWLPIGAAGPLAAAPGFAGDRFNSFLYLIARLQPGRSRLAAAREATLVHRRVYAALGDREAAGRQITLGSIAPGSQPYRALEARLAVWLAGMSGLVLLIACANVANLLLVRGLDRRRELAVRLALGSGRGVLARLLLAESLLLALLGGLAAWWVARLVMALLRAFLLSEGARAESGFDPRRLALLAASSLLAGLLSGLAPAFFGRRSDLLASMHDAPGIFGPGRSRVRSALLVSQVALTFALLVSAGLFLASLQRARSLRLGFEPDRVLLGTYDLRGFGSKPQEVAALYRRALERVRGLPGVERASIAAGIPFRSSFGISIALPGRADVWDLIPGGIYYNAVGEDFFSTLGTALLTGRPLTVHDAAGAERVAVVNATMAARLWPGQSPLGRCFKVGDEHAPCTTIVGVVEDARRNQLREPPTFQFYVPLAQAPDMGASALFVRTSSDPAHLITEVRHALQGAASGLPYAEVRGMNELLASQVRPWRLGARLFSVLGLLALALAGVGLFGALAHSAAMRAHELGVRKALGASLRSLLAQVFGFALSLAAVGIGLGWLGSALAARFLEPILFETSARDPRAYLAAALTLGLAALVATLPVARHTARLDPAIVLRTD
jgi:predicted permease